MKLEEIIPEIHTLTTGFYYRELQKLVNYLISFSISFILSLFNNISLNSKNEFP